MSRIALVVVFVLLFGWTGSATAFDLARADANRIGHRIWQNECAGTVTGLTSWNAGEEFASIGIGHFIWYPEGKRGPFEESFPDLVAFLSAHGTKLPGFLAEGKTTACPWNSRADFLAAKSTPRMIELREMLAATVDLQTDFLVARLRTSLAKMLAETFAENRPKVQRNFERVSASAQGFYALVDYVNFKGEGVLATERYRGQGWGLLQVLEGMSGSTNGTGAVAEFAASARAVLTRRVENSPPERREARWLPGWLNRIKSYNSKL